VVHTGPAAERPSRSAGGRQIHLVRPTTQIRLVDTGRSRRPTGALA